jgi:carboxymethylenebutenolidase
MDKMETRDISPSELKGGGYLAITRGTGPHPGVVVIHEAAGLTENIKETCRRLADEGYVALAVDLLSGRNRAICMARYMSGMLLGSVNRYGIDDLRASLTLLAKQPEVDASRMGAIGFCMGGSFAIAWACTDSRLKVIAPFYGTNPRPLEVVRRLCPVVGSYPENDFTGRAAKSLEAELDRSGIAHDIKVYPDTRHSFFNPEGSAYNKRAADDSWRRVIQFFGDQLQNKQ